MCTHVATKFATCASHFNLGGKKKEREKEKIRRYASVIQDLQYRYILHTRTDHIVDHDNGLLFRIAADTLSGESKREQNAAPAGDMFDKILCFFFSRSILRGVRNRRYNTEDQRPLAACPVARSASSMPRR